MSGTLDAASGLAIDHSWLFKDLLTTFLVELLHLRFRFLVVQLNRLSWRRFVNPGQSNSQRVDA